MNLSISKENVHQLLSALRLQNPTQYYTLVKMHLSFVTDHATDQCEGCFYQSSATSSNKWNLSPLMRKFIMRGNNPSQESDKFLLTVDVVHRVFELIRFLNKDENIVQEGLFRKTGSVARQAELKAALQAGKNLNLSSEIYSAHDCASVLKSFLADLPEPLLQEEEYHVKCRIAALCGQHEENERQSAEYIRLMKALRLVFLLLPSLNYEILKELLFFLHRVTSFQQINKMSPLNLGTMFAPHILCSRKMSPSELQNLSGSLSNTIAFLIENTPDLFEIPPELGIDIMEYFRTAEIEKQMTSKCEEDAPTKTSITFVDRELTAQVTDGNVTEVALAELYAYVQSLPDSAKKQKLITQFNDVNGRGTPKYDLQTTQAHSHKKEFRIKSLGDSIKKHLFSRSVKKAKPQKQVEKTASFKRSNSEDILSTSTVYCSPELRTNQKSPKIKTRSFDNLLSPKSSSDSRQSFWNCSFSSKSVNKDRISLRSSSIEGDDTTPKRSSLVSLSTPTSKTDRKVSCSSEADRDLRKKRGPQTTPPTSKKTLPPKQIFAPECSSNSELSPLHRNVRKGFRDSVGDSLEERQTEQSNVDMPSTSTRSVKELSGKGSPISRAIRNFGGHQGLMMTPRSRCPIIINSSSSLSSVAIHEDTFIGSERITENSTHDCASNTGVEHNFYDETKAQESSSFINSFCSRQTHNESLNCLSESIEKTHNQTSLVVSLADDSGMSSSFFSGFFKHLSTSSLIKLVAKLSSTATTSSPPPSPNVTISSLEIYDSSCNKIEDGSHDDSLSAVFKDYLLSRSILTENPIDLSTDNLVFDFGNEEYEKDKEKSTLQSYPHDKDSEANGSQKNILPPSLVYNPSKDLEKAIPDLSHSLLYCLDGNNPLYYKEKCNAKRRSHPHDCEVSRLALKKNRSENKPITREDRTPLAERTSTSNNREDQNTLQSSVFKGSNKPHNLHSCSPDSRSASILKNRNGTPLPHREKDKAGGGATEVGTQSVLFETEL